MLPIDDATWGELAGRAPPVHIETVGEDYGQSSSLRRVRWADGSSGVLKVSHKRARGARELQFLQAMRGSDWPQLLGFIQEPERVILLLEDLGDAVPGDILAGISASDTRAAVEVLARLHSAPVPSAWPSAATRWRHVTEADVHAFLQRYAHPWATERLPTLQRAVAAHIGVLQQVPRAMTHRDAHLDNWMFRPEPVLLDWETASVGPAIVDLARFFMEGPHTDVRRQVQDELIQRWAQTVVPGREAEVKTWLRAAVWYMMDAMIPYHGSVDLQAMSPRMRRVHEHTVMQGLTFAQDLGLYRDGQAG